MYMCLWNKLLSKLIEFNLATVSALTLSNCDKKWGNILHGLLFFLHVANLGTERLLGKLIKRYDTKCQ